MIKNYIIFYNKISCFIYKIVSYYYDIHQIDVQNHINVFSIRSHDETCMIIFCAKCYSGRAALIRLKIITMAVLHQRPKTHF